MTGVRLLTSLGLLIAGVTAQVVVPVGDATTAARFASATEAGETISFGGGSVHALRAGRFVEIARCEGTVSKVRRFGDTTWILSVRGAHAAPVTFVGPPVTLPEPRVIDAAAIGDDVWCATPTGAWRVRAGKAVRIPDLDLRINTVRAVGNTVWMATSGGVYRVVGDRPERVTDDVFVSTLHVTPDHVWAATTHRLIRLGSDGIPKAFGPMGGLGSVVANGQSVWFGQGNEIRRVQDGRLVTMAGVVGHLIGITPHDGQTAFITSKGVWIGSDDRPRPILSAEVTCHTSPASGDTLWVGTKRGLFSVRGGSIKRLTTEACAPTAMIEEGGTIWVASNRGVGRLHETGVITATVEVDRGPWLNGVGVVSGDAVWSSEQIDVRFKHSIDEIGGAFQAIVTTNASELEQRVRAGRFAAAPVSLTDLPVGATTLHIAVRDRAGNINRITIDGRVVGTFPAFVAVVVGAWLTFVMATLAFASKNKVCHRVLMSRWLRSFGSLGIIPLMLRLRAVRNHTIAPYLKALRNDKWSQGALQYAVPTGDYQPDALMKTAAQRGPMVVVGELGSGKTALLRSLYTRAIRDTDTGAAVPVLLSLGLSSGGIRQAFYDQLERLGDITDPALCRTLLRCHRFLIVIDGWERLDAAERELARGFLEAKAKHSLVIIATDPSMVPEGFHRLNLPRPNEALCRKILCTKVRPDHLEPSLNRVRKSPDLALPQHLEVLGAVVEAETAPQALDVRTLYAAHIERSLAAWEGHPWVPQLRADVARGIAKGDLEGFAAIAALDEPAREHIQRAGWVQGRRLRHPIIGAYVAAGHLAASWDSNPELPWHSPVMPSLLRFLILELEAIGRSNALRALIMEALEHAQSVGESTMEWLTKVHPDLRESIFAVPA